MKRTAAKYLNNTTLTLFNPYYIPIHNMENFDIHEIRYRPVMFRQWNNNKFNRNEAYRHLARNDTYCIRGNRVLRYVNAPSKLE